MTTHSEVSAIILPNSSQKVKDMPSTINIFFTGATGE